MKNKCKRNSKHGKQIGENNNNKRKKSCRRKLKIPEKYAQMNRQSEIVIDDKLTSSHDNLFSQSVLLTFIILLYLYAGLLYVISFFFASLVYYNFNEFFFNSHRDLLIMVFFFCFRNYRCAESVNMRAASPASQKKKRRTKFSVK